jgi:type VI secretion system protein VasI
MDNKKIAGCAVVALLLLWGIGRIASSSSPVAATPSVGAPLDDKWLVTENPSPMDDSKTVVLRLESESTIQGPLGTVKPTLFLRCKEKKTDVYVSTEMAARIEEGLDGGPSAFHTVRIRLDDGTATQEAWTESTDHRALFVPDMVYDSSGNFAAISGGVVAFAKRLAGAKTLVFEFTPFDGTPQTTRFNLQGLNKHLRRIGEACGWAVE